MTDTSQKAQNCGKMLAMSAVEIPLKGGRVTAGVVRIGETVRRPVLADRTLVQELLIHAEAESFEGTPRYLGVDEQRREILSFLPGDVPEDLCCFNDRTLGAAAGLLRRFHDMSIGLMAQKGLKGQVLCHNDWAPTNAVFRDDLPYGIIDFDTIAPGLRLWDLGYSAFTWLDLGNPTYTGGEQIRRLAVFAQGYGSPLFSVAEIASTRWLARAH
jgi:Phosphotransferase enzyme family